MIKSGTRVPGRYPAVPARVVGHFPDFTCRRSSVENQALGRLWFRHRRRLPGAVLVSFETRVPAGVRLRISGGTRGSASGEPSPIVCVSGMRSNALDDTGRGGAVLAAPPLSNARS